MHNAFTPYTRFRTAELFTDIQQNTVSTSIGGHLSGILAVREARVV